MQIKIEAGAEIDVLSSGEFKEGLKGIGDARANYYHRSASIVTAGTATNGNVVGLGSPPVGRMWDVLGITTAGVDDFTVVAGFVSLYVGNHNTMPLSDLKVPHNPIPTYNSIGKGRIYCMASEALYASVNGVAAGTLVYVQVQVAEWRESDLLNNVTR